MPPDVLMRVNKSIVFRLMRRVNQRLLCSACSGAPPAGRRLWGGALGARLDAWILGRIAGQAPVEFPSGKATEGPVPGD